MKPDPYINQEMLKFMIKAEKLLDSVYSDNLFLLIYTYLTQRELKTFLRKSYAHNNKSKQSSHDSNDDEIDLKKDFISSRAWESTFDSLHRKKYNLYKKIFGEIIDHLKLKIKTTKPRSPYLKKLKQVQTTFYLTDKECEILTFFYLLNVNKDFGQLFEHNFEMDEIDKSIPCFMHVFDLKTHEVKQNLSKSSTLLKTGIIQITYKRGKIELNDNILEYMIGLSDKHIIECFLSPIEHKDSLNLEDHRVKKENIQTVKGLINTDHGVNILLHGTPGTGKTEFAKSLAKELNRNLYFVQQKNEDGEESDNHRRTGIIAALNLLDPKRDILVIDECDEIINLKSSFFFFEEKVNDKSWINDLLETSKQKVIWITNRINGIDDSTKRRFSYTIEFSSFSQKQRQKVWLKQIEAQNIDFLNDELVDEFSQHYKINPGSISLALRDVKAAQLNSDDEKISLLKELLQQHQQFIFGKAPEINLNQKYSLEVLNTDHDLSQVINTCQRFYEMSQVQDKPLIQNMNILLQGSPGTGKTEFAKYLSQKLKKELIIKRLSDIRSPWYGQSLINIAEMFKEAQNKESILFLDEADTFFMPRESSHQFYTSETNELLTQMENFKGILICATNFSTNMDQASMRRFNYKIRFDYLSNQSKVLLFEKTFGLGNLSQEQINRLHRIPALTPGDFKVVLQKNFFDENKNIDKIISELEVEVKYKKETTKTVGLV
jgi:transitional endoplasmic reticulum ATPase